MKNHESWLSVCALIGFGVAGVSAHAAQTRPTYPGVIGIEALGRAASASVYFDRMLDADFAAGVGYGGGPVPMVPVYANYYLGSEQGSLFLTAGVSMVLNPNSARGKLTAAGDWKIQDNVIPQLGLGYENRSDQGYLFRGTGYAVYSGSQFKPWVGVSFGYAF
jgi:hypothetical protein